VDMSIADYTMVGGKKKKKKKKKKKRVRTNEHLDGGGSDLK